MKLLIIGLCISVATMAATAAPIQIVAYGDSGVYGKGVARNETYPAQLESMLRQKGYAVNVINDGENGRTSSDAVANLGRVGKADVVIVQFGVNDAKHGVAIETIRKNVETVVTRLKANGAAVLVVSYPSANVCEVASAHNAPCVMWGDCPVRSITFPAIRRNISTPQDSK
jgi:acyl-CoA thioesterase-1